MIAHRKPPLFAAVLLCAATLLSSAGTAGARPPACEGNLVQASGLRDQNALNAWDVKIGSPDFDALDTGHAGLWGNRAVGEALGQALGGGGLRSGVTYLLTARARHGADPGKRPYSQIRLVAWPAGAAPRSYADLFTAPRVEIGVSQRISSTAWQEVSFGPWTAPTDLAGVALHVVNEHAVDDGAFTSYANVDDLCIRQPVPPTLCGSKFLDAACDGQRGEGDGPLAGWEILLTGPDGSTRTTTTGPDGSYCFDGLTPGLQTVAERSRPGWVQTAPRPNGTHVVEVGLEGDLTGLDFANQLCAQCPEEDCPSAEDPNVDYVTQDPELCARIRLICDPGEEPFSGPCGCGCRAPCERRALASGLLYPGESCSSAVRTAERAFTSAHYRNACAEAYGGERPERVGVKAVASCRPSGDGVMLDVEVCCPTPPGEPDPVVTKELVGPSDDLSVHLVFQIRVENRGTAAMPGPVEVKDVLPEGYFFASSSQCTSADRKVVTCSQPGGLPPGQSATFELVAELERSAFADRTNCAALASVAGGGDPANDTACLPLPCPDRQDPTVHYLVERGSRDDHAQCKRLSVRCGDSQTFFWGACGCGCIDQPKCVRWPDSVEPRPGKSELPATDLAGLLTLPEELHPGDEVAVTPLDPERTPADGTWRINGEVLERREPGPSVLCPRDPWWTFRVPDDWAAGMEVLVTYTSSAGDVLVEAEAPEVEVGEPLGDELPQPFIEGGTPFTVPGGTACACGAFPTPESRSGLLLDGRALGPPAAASRSSLHFRVPLDTPLGDHRVSGWPGVGFSSGSGWDLGLVRVEASLDTSTLARGGSTRLQLRVVGTERPVTLRLQNFSPSVVVVEGGDDQFLTTSGGGENVAVTQVRGVGRGAFDLRWALPVCPCGG
jgi:hypothetical protein